MLLLYSVIRSFVHTLDINFSSKSDHNRYPGSYFDAHAGQFFMGAK